MLTAALAFATLAILHNCVNAQSVAKLTFDQEYPSYYQTVWITCASAAVAERSDLSELKFYALDSSYTYTLTRNCSTNGLTESDTGFNGNVVYWNGNRNQSVYLLWSNLTTELNKLQFQCSITGCTSNEPATSNNASITVLPDPSQPKIEPQLPIMLSGKPSNVSLTCSGFVGYPGGNLELQLTEITQIGEKRTNSHANFSADVEGNAHGSYLFETDRTTSYSTFSATCVASNNLNSGVPKISAFSDEFLKAKPPSGIYVSIGQYAYIPGKNFSQLIIINANQTIPMVHTEIKCCYFEAAPEPNVQMTLLSTEYEAYFTKVSNDTYILNYDGPDTLFAVLNCTVNYESMSEPNIKSDYFIKLNLNVWSVPHSIATVMTVSQLLLVAASALLWKL